jgi:hypothetical protein
MAATSVSHTVEISLAPDPAAKPLSRALLCTFLI